MVDDVVTADVEARGQHALGERQTDRHREPLAERPGGRLDPGECQRSGCPPWPAS